MPHPWRNVPLNDSFLSIGMCRYKGVHHVPAVNASKPFKALGPGRDQKPLGYFATAVEAAVAYAKFVASPDEGAGKGVQEEAASTTPPELLDLVRRMCDHFGWMRADKLQSELDPVRRMQGSGMDIPNPWLAQLPDELRNDPVRVHEQMYAALRIVKSEHKASGCPLPDRKKQRRR